MASIKKRSTTQGPRYDVRYRTPTGEVRTKTFTRDRDARRFANNVEVEKTRGSFVDPRAGRITLDDYASDWLATRPSLRPRSRDTYAAQYRLHIPGHH